MQLKVFDSQTTVALAIVLAMTILGVGLIMLIGWRPTLDVVIAGFIGAIIGSLATALNSPTGNKPGATADTGPAAPSIRQPGS